MDPYWSQALLALGLRVALHCNCGWHCAAPNLARTQRALRMRACREEELQIPAGTAAAAYAPSCRPPPS